MVLNTSWTTEKPFKSSIYCINDMICDLKMNKLTLFKVAKLWYTGTRLRRKNKRSRVARKNQLLLELSNKLNEGTSNYRSAGVKNDNVWELGTNLICGSRNNFFEGSILTIWAFLIANRVEVQLALDPELNEYIREVQRVIYA